MGKFFGLLPGSRVREPYFPHMISFLRTYPLVVLAAMAGLTAWASSVQALWKIPAEVGKHPWFLATLGDAYFGFLFFWLWVAYKERSWLVRLGWLAAILLLGNMAMAAYVLLQAWSIPAESPIEKFLLRKNGRTPTSRA